MKRSNLFFLSFILWLFAGNLSAQKPVKLVQSDILSPAESAAIGGYVGEKLNASYQNRILAQDVERLIEPFRNRTEDRCWQSEFWGKWFTSAVLAYRYRPEPQLKAILDHAVSGLLSTQTPDGYIGNYADNKHMEGWDIWGRKYCMLGLLSYYDLTKDKNSLIATMKIADFLIKELADRNEILVKKGAHRGMAASSVLEPICLLYARTGEKRYLDFANQIVRQWETPDGPQLISKSSNNVAERFPRPVPQKWFSWDQGQKAYEMMSCYEGLLELYRLTGNQDYLHAVEKTWQNILDTEINVTGSGSAMECWFGGKHLQTMHIDHYQETCVTVTWIKLSQQLLRLTGDAKYADAIEQTWYNALLGSMKPDGSDWAKYSPLAGERLEGDQQCGMGLNCCVASGPRGLFTLPLTAVMGKQDGININFFADGRYRARYGKDKEVEVIQRTDYPVSGNISLTIVLPKEDQLAVRIRIPQWSNQSVLTVNGEAVQNILPGEFAEIKRMWKSGDIINLTTDMRGRLVRMGDSPENVAILRGPIVLTRDERLGKPHVDATIQPIAGKDGYLNLKSVYAGNDGIWMKFKNAFKVESHKEGGGAPIDIVLCDFASAGNTFNENSWFRVWLPQSVDPRQSGQPVAKKDTATNKITVFTIGDSTMANKKAEVAPETGWCQVLSAFFDERVVVKNRAVNGRSTKSFINEGRWKAVLDTLKKGDYVFIQFGHNDQKIQDSTRYAEPFTTYRQNLARFVAETREKGATPILFTSIVRRKFENGKLVDTHGDYPVVVRRLAAEMNVSLIDLQQLTAKAISDLGEEASKKIYLWTAPTAAYPEGRKDDTHLCVEGANLVAKLAAQQLALLNNSLAKRVIVP